jgi:hypothetical protein
MPAHPERSKAAERCEHQAPINAAIFAGQRRPTYSRRLTFAIEDGSLELASPARHKRAF